MGEGDRGEESREQHLCRREVILFYDLKVKKISNKIRERWILCGIFVYIMGVKSYTSLFALLKKTVRETVRSFFIRNC